MAKKLTKQRIIEVLKQVKDPEIGLDVWTLGLIYNVVIKGNDAQIKMTLTSPMCPFGQTIMLEIKSGMQKLGCKDPKIELTFDPPWKPSKEVRAMLGV